LDARPTLTLHPDEFSLGAGESRLVYVTIDLSCLNLSKGIIETSIDVLMDDSLALKLWVEVDVYG